MAAEQAQQAEQPPAHSRISEAVDARDELAAALTDANIQIPAMDVRQKPTYGLVVLGEVSAPIARDLAAVITRGARR